MCAEKYLQKVKIFEKLQKFHETTEYRINE